MVKKLLIMVFAGLISLPAVTKADTDIADLEERIDELEETITTMEESAEKWDLSSRIQWNGDYRFSLWYVNAETPAFWWAGDVAEPFSWFLSAGQDMNRWWSSQNNDPNLTMNDFMNVFNADVNDLKNGIHTPVADRPSMMTDKELLTFDTMLATHGINTTLYDVLHSHFSSPLGDEVALFINAQNLANYFSSQYQGYQNTSTGNFAGQSNVGLNLQQRLDIMSGLGYGMRPAATYTNDTIALNRFRLNLRAKATENMEIKATFVVYKAWGMENNPVDYYNNFGLSDPMETTGGVGGKVTDTTGPFLYNTVNFDGNNTRVPTNNLLKVDRMFANWNNVFDMPFWFSAGRRPTTDGPPAQFKLGADKRMATPMAFMDYPFDGMTIGYAWRNPWPGRGRFCAGRGFESGPTISGEGVNDTDFAGFAFDLYKKDNAFLYLQTFGAFNMMNVPDNVMFWNPLERAMLQFNQEATDAGERITFANPGNGILDRANLGNIYHTDAVWYDTIGKWDYFAAAGWSRTDPSGYDEVGVGLLSIWWDPDVLKERDGFAGYVGTRYTLDDLGLKVGAEFNYGSKYWIAFTPGNDDLYAAKLATRGWATEAYLIWDIPAGEMISKFGKAFFRLGWIHYNYDYSGSGFWLGAPDNLDDLNDPLKAQFNAPAKTVDSAYLTYEAWF